MRRFPKQSFEDEEHHQAELGDENITKQSLVTRKDEEHHQAELGDEKNITKPSLVTRRKDEEQAW